MRADFEYKLVVVVRGDLEMSPGKMAAQVGHACVTCALFAEKKCDEWFDSWYREGQKKVVVKANDLA